MRKLILFTLLIGGGVAAAQTSWFMLPVAPVVAAGGPPYSDTFAGTGALGSGWTVFSGNSQFGPIGRVSGSLTPTGSPAEGYIYWNTPLPGDQWAQVTITHGTGQEIGIDLRADVTQQTDLLTGSSYQMYFGTDTGITLLRDMGTDGASYDTPAASFGCSGSSAGTHTYKINAVGNVISGYQDGTLICQWTDTSHGGGGAHPNTDTTHRTTMLYSVCNGDLAHCPTITNWSAGSGAGP